MHRQQQQDDVKAKVRGRDPGIVTLEVVTAIREQTRRVEGSCERTALENVGKDLDDPPY